jgi:hypothetical protein
VDGRKGSIVKEGIQQAAAGGLFVFVVSYLLVVPGNPYWGLVTDRFGESGLIIGLIAVCVVCGAVFAALTGVRFQFLLAGGAVVYTLWLFYLEASAGPFDSSVHIILGALLLTGFVVGAALVERSTQ